MMTISSSLNYTEDCFYEKRINTFLHGSNDINNHWISDFDCLDRCLTIDSPKCRSFEYWRSNRYGLCIRTNMSLTDNSSVTGHNAFVDYYEIDCGKTTTAIKPQTIYCPGDQLYLTVTLNGINPNEILLGDSNCKPIWSNDTHAQFITQIDSCSLIVTNGSIIGKLRWEGLYKVSSFAKRYERFFHCPSEIHQTRLTQVISTKPTLSMNSTRHRLSSPSHNTEQQITTSYKITLEWTVHNRSYSCPESCFISLYSFINITLDDLSSLPTTFLIDSCYLKALYPYTDYVQSRRLIYQGCSIDPTVIHISKNSSPSSIFHISFYLYHILKEPIPFQIQCKILHHDEKFQIQQNTDCLSTFSDDNDRLVINKNDKRDYSYTLFRSSSVYVTRQLPLVEYEEEILHNENSIILTAAVHYKQCSFFAFFLLILCKIRMEIF